MSAFPAHPDSFRTVPSETRDDSTHFETTTPKTAAPLNVELDRMRVRLLDLSGRNRLIHFRHTAGKSLQFVQSHLEGVFKRLTTESQQKVHLRTVPEPTLNLSKEPGQFSVDAKEHAASLGWNTSFELIDFNRDISQNSRETLPAPSSLQTLMYAQDLATHARKLHRAAQSAIEETGANMLYLVFGFLEFPDSLTGSNASSNTVHQAPLLCLPVKLHVVQDSPWPSFHLTADDGELVDNPALQERLKRDFGIYLPAYDNEKSPDVAEYLAEIQNAVGHLPQWRVCRMMTLT